MTGIVAEQEVKGSILGRLGFAIVTIELELLAGATSWPLLVALLFSATTSLTCL